MTTIPKNSPSLCIPRAFGNITKKRVVDVMKECKFGVIDRIDEISKVNENGENVKRFFVHFKYWFKGWDAERARLLSGESERLKIVYDDPWYWMVKSSNPAAAFKPRDNQSQKKKIFVARDQMPRAVEIDIENTTDTSVNSEQLRIEIDAETPDETTRTPPACESVN